MCNNLSSKRNINNILKSKKTTYIILTLIIIAGICRFSYGFFIEKKGTHSDEEWSFGLANSYYEPYIYSSDDRIYSKNTNEWISGEKLKNYLTVQNGERFSFDSVYYNLSCDMHPPLYFFILHFLSSFFINQYIPALGFLINIVCYIFMSLFLYKTLILMSKSPFISLLGVFFNTFNVGMLSMMVFLRMYAMVAMFAIMLVYYNAMLYYDSTTQNKKSTYIKLAVTSCLGALTHHFFLPYAFIFTAGMCIYWLVKKKWSILFKYAFCMIIGVSLSIAIFPATIDHMFGIKTFSYRDQAIYNEENISANNIVSLQDWNSSNTDRSSNFSTDDIENYNFIIFKFYFATCLQMIFKDFLGYPIISAYKQGIFLYMILFVLFVTFISIPLSFLLRNEPTFIAFKQKIISKIKKIKVNWFYISIILSILFVVGICSYKVNVLLMNIFTTRYLFIIYPLVSLLLVYFIAHIIMFIFKRKNIFHLLLSVISISLLCINNYKTESSCAYLFKNTDNIKEIEELTSNSNVIVVSTGCWLLTVYTPILQNCSNLIYLSTNSFFNNLDKLDNLDNNKKTYLILDTSYLLNDSNQYDLNTDVSTSISTYAYSDIDPANIVFNRNIQNTNDNSHYYKETYLNYLLSSDSIRDCKYITSGKDFNINMDIFEIYFK